MLIFLFAFWAKPIRISVIAPPHKPFKCVRSFKASFKLFRAQASSEGDLSASAAYPCAILVPIINSRYFHGALSFHVSWYWCARQESNLQRDTAFEAGASAYSATGAYKMLVFPSRQPVSLRTRTARILSPDCSTCRALMQVWQDINGPTVAHR